MTRRKVEDEDTLVLNDFERKARDLDFDPWGVEEEDGSQRRRDPFRKPTGFRPEEEEEQ